MINQALVTMTIQNKCSQTDKHQNQTNNQTNDQANNQKNSQKIQKIQTLRYLVVGKMGDGKSELCKFLTGDENIKTSGQTKSCTHKCEIFTSKFQIECDGNKFNIDVIDTPGIDSKEQSIYSMIQDLTEIFQKNQQIHGIIYVISIVRDRDESIPWFRNFLRIFFTKEQLKSSFIPILTRFDNVLLDDKKEIDLAKQNRKKGFRQVYGNSIQDIWKNHIEWINKGKKSEEIQNNQRMLLQQLFNKMIQDKQKTQIQQLFSKKKKITVDINKRIAQFYKQIVEKTKQKLNGDYRKKYKKINETLEAVQIDVKLNQIGFWKGTLNLLTYPYHYFFPKISTEIECLIFNDDKRLKQGIKKLVEYIFWEQFRLKIRTFQKSGIFTNSFQMQFSETTDISGFQLKKLWIQKVGQQKKVLTFPLQNLNIIFQGEGKYLFSGVQIQRPQDKFFEEIFEQCIKKDQKEQDQMEGHLAINRHGESQNCQVM